MLSQPAGSPKAGDLRSEGGKKYGWSYNYSERQVVIMSKSRSLGLLLILLVPVAFLISPVGLAQAVPADWVSPGLSEAGQSVISEGVLIYYPPPDLTICFCGSYFLSNSDRTQQSYYLLAPGLDLTRFIGKQISVTGKPALIPCTGTLLQNCDFLVLEEVEETTTADDEETTWGKIKAVYK